MSRWPLLLLPLLLATTACKSIVPNRGAADRSDELARIRERVLELERQGRILEVELTRLRRQVAELEERVEKDEASPPVETRRPPLPEVVPAPVERPEAEDLEMPPAPPPAPPEPTPECGTPAPVSGAGQELYDRGYTLYHQGSYVDAESAFQGFLREYGSSDLADNAQFWIGEARLKRGDLDGALAAFRETVNRFPRGNKVPDALFRSGDCLEKLGDLDGARAAWRETIERYPSSAAAALSEERLAAVP